MSMDYCSTRDVFSEDTRCSDGAFELAWSEMCAFLVVIGPFTSHIIHLSVYPHLWKGSSPQNGPESHETKRLPV